MRVEIRNKITTWSGLIEHTAVILINAKCHKILLHSIDMFYKTIGVVLIWCVCLVSSQTTRICMVTHNTST